MHFITKLTAIAAATATAVSATNTVTFVSQDDTSRTVVFTPSAGSPEVDSVDVPGMATQVVTIPDGWIGNWYSVSEGAEQAPGMLGEVTFQGWAGITYFDVSAIVNPNDHNGVKEIFPASENELSVKSTLSGCSIFPCNTAYYLADDVQTVTTTETDLICTLGGSDSTSKRDAANLVPRKFVLGQA